MKQYTAFKKAIIISGVFFLSLLFYSCSPQKPQDKKRIVTVVIEKARKGNLDSFLKLNGTLYAKNSILVFPDVPGKVDHIVKFEGSYVKKDDIIMYIDRSQIGSAFNLAYVKAPVKGHVTSISVTPGYTVSPGMSVAAIGDIEFLDLHINVPERWVPEIKADQDVTFTVPARGSEVFHAKIYRKDYAINNQSQTLLVRASLNNKEQKLLPGMYADAAIKIKSARDVYIVPTSALITIGNKKAVYIKPQTNDHDNGKKSKKKSENTNPSTNYLVNLKTIDILFNSETEAAVAGGLTAQDEIVVFGKEFLSEGVLVNPVHQNQK